MRKSKQSSGERIVKDIKRKTRKQYSAEEKIRIVLDGLRGEESIAEFCRQEGIAQGLYYKWSKDFLEAGKKRLAGDISRQANSSEVKGLRRRKGDVERFFDSLSPDLCPEHVTSLCRIGVSRSGTALPVFVPVFWNAYKRSDSLTPWHDGPLTEELIAGIPRYAFDGFTRAGSRYLKNLARESEQLRAFLTRCAPQHEHDTIVRNLYFRIETSLCATRLNWPAGNEARKRADETAFGIDVETFNIGKSLLRAALGSMPMTEADL